MTAPTSFSRSQRLVNDVDNMAKRARTDQSCVLEMFKTMSISMSPEGLGPGQADELTRSLDIPDVQSFIKKDKVLFKEVFSGL